MNIAHVVRDVRRYMNNPCKEHWNIIKWILRYLRGTTTQVLCFEGSNIVLQGNVDLDMAWDIDRRRRTTWYVFTVNGTKISWISKLKKFVYFQQWK
jgi:hypothetical protein